MAERDQESPSSLLARTWHIARFLLAETPDDAERWIALIEAGPPVDPIATNRFVLGLGPEGDRAYIVHDGGTFTTRGSLPDWAMPSDVIEIPLPTSGMSTVWTRLSESAEQLRSVAPDVYADFGIQESLDVIERYYRDPEHATAVTEGLSSLATVPLSHIRELLSEPEAARTWASSAAHAVGRQFVTMRLPIAVAARALGTFQLIARGEDPRIPLAAGLLRVLQPAIGPDDVQALMQDFDAVARIADEFPIPNARVGIEFEPGFYAITLEFAGFGGIKYAWDIGCELQDHADPVVAAARRETSIERFYVSLADALLRYRAADAIFVELTKMLPRTDDRPDWLATLEDRRVLSEERRVTFLGSFMAATGLISHKLNPTSFQSIGTWITYLAEKPLSDAKAALHDFALRLVIPRFMRDLMLGSVLRLAGELDAARSTLMRSREALERDRAANSRVPAEPNFLVPLNEELARIEEGLGDDDEAARFRRRAVAESTRVIGEAAAPDDEERS